MVYNLHYPIEYIEKELSKLKPLNYNRFFWWRRWACKKSPLGKKSKLIDKITNGDFDYSHYKWQAHYTEWEINEKYKDSIDSSHFIELTKIDRNRRKRLLEDFEKDELEKLSLIKKHFCKRFKIDEDTYEEEVVKFGGTLEEFYYYCLKKYKN